MSLLIKNGRVITAVDDYKGDIFVESEQVNLIGKNLDVKADRVIDAQGKYVIPGGIDPHLTLTCHLPVRFPQMISKQEHGQRLMEVLPP